MHDKTLALVSLGLSAASQAFIRDRETALFYSVIFFTIAIYEFILSELKKRKSG